MRAAEARLAEILRGWHTRVRMRPGRAARPDGTLVVDAPDGTTVQFLVEAKAVIEPRTAQRIASEMRRREGRGLVIAPFLSPRAREELRIAEVSYLDLTGNVFIRSDQPAILVDAHGADRDPQRAEKTTRTLKGPKAGRIVRTLCDWKGPLKISQIAKLAHTDVGYTSRVVDMLDREALIERVPRGPVLRVDWNALIRRLASDYSMLESNRTQAFLEPRGIPALEEKLRTAKFPFLLTGSIAAYKIAPVAPPRMATFYVEDIEQAATKLGLHPAEVGANVILLEPAQPLRFFHTWRNDGLKLAGLSQITADLLTGPGRSPQEAEALLDWMERHEAEWRLVAA